jgi:hypothetical protein
VRLLEVAGVDVEFETLSLGPDFGPGWYRVQAVRTGTLVHLLVDGRYLTTGRISPAGIDLGGGGDVLASVLTGPERALPSQPGPA